MKFKCFFSVTLQVLYKLKTSKVFERHKCRSPDVEEDPFAIQQISMCSESRLMCVAGLTHVLLFTFSKKESSVECTVSTWSTYYLNIHYLWHWGGGLKVD